MRRRLASVLMLGLGPILGFGSMWEFWPGRGAMSVMSTPAAAQQHPLRGTWHPETYILKDGSRHALDGLVVFTDTQWTFLVFVMVGGEARRGEGEGGTYVLERDELVFNHEYLLTAGQAVGSLPESPLRMQVRDTASASRTPSRVSLEGDRLTVRFGPSGNSMVFRRLTRF